MLRVVVLFSTVVWLSPAFGFISHSQPSKQLRQCQPGRPCWPLWEKSSNEAKPSTLTEFLVQVQFEDFDNVDTIAVRRGESLLSALERAASSLGMGDIPSDCRRGNCLTCCAKHAKASATEHVKPLSEDGLSPSVSINSQENDGFLLTCRSTVTGPGVVLQLGQNSNIWKRIYQTRFEDDATRQATNEALARVLRKAAESDPDTWLEQAEALWQKQDKHLD